MNDRIRQLIEQAGVYYNDSDYDHSDLEALQKFAELIVKECAKDFDKTYMSGGQTMGDYIRQKFGVEE